MEAQLLLAKFEGLAAVESLLKTSLGDTSKETYYSIESIDKNALNSLLKGEIKRITDLRKFTYENKKTLEPLRRYKIFIKTIVNKTDNSVPSINLVDSIFII